MELETAGVSLLLLLGQGHSLIIMDDMKRSVFKFGKGFDWEIPYVSSPTKKPFNSISRP